MARMASVTDCTRVYHGAPALRPPPNVCYPAGTARAPFVRRGATASVASYAAAYVSHPPVGGGVLDAPCSRDRWGGLDALVRRGQPHPRRPRCARLASTTQRIQSRGHRPRTIFYGRTHVVRRPTPGGRGSPPLRWVGSVYGQRGCGAPTSASTPQSRRKAPRQLPFQGSRKGGCGAPASPGHPRRAGVEARPYGARASTTQKGPVLGPVLFALKCPWAFQA